MDTGDRCYAALRRVDDRANTREDVGVHDSVQPLLWVTAGLVVPFAAVILARRVIQLIREIVMMLNELLELREAWSRRPSMTAQSSDAQSELRVVR